MCRHGTLLKMQTNAADCMDTQAVCFAGSVVPGTAWETELDSSFHPKLFTSPKTARQTACLHGALT